MVPIEMPLDAKLALAKMSVIYEREEGTKVKMSRDEDIIRIINFAVDSFNEEIIKYLHAFTTLLGPSEIRQLVEQGANIYRGAVVSDEPEAAPQSYQGAASTKTYRGVAVPTDETMQAAPAKAEEPQPKKSKRVYRGRVIED